MEIQVRNNVADCQELLQVFPVGTRRDRDDYSKADCVEREIDIFKIGSMVSEPHIYIINDDIEMVF